MDREVKVRQLSNFILGLNLEDSSKVGDRVYGNMQKTPYMVNGLMLDRGEAHDLVCEYKKDRKINCLYEFAEWQDLLESAREDVRNKLELLNLGKLVNNPFERHMEIEISKEYSKEIGCSYCDFTLATLKFMLKPIDEEDLSKGESIHTILEVRAKDKRLRLLAHEIGEKFQIKSLKNPKEFGNNVLVQMTTMGIIKPIVLEIEDCRFTIDCTGIYANGSLAGKEDSEDVYISGWDNWKDNKNIKTLLKIKSMKKLGVALSLLEKCRKNIAPYWVLENNKIRL